MASNVTLLETRTEVRQRTHYERSQFVTDPELNVWIARSYKELYDLLVSQFAGSYYYTSSDFTIATANTFSVPADFYHLTGLDYVVLQPDQLTPLRRISFAERNSGRQGYDLRGNVVYILPYNWAAGRTFRLYYVPTPGPMVADTDVFDGVDGWEEYVIADVCIKVCGKSGEDASVFGAQKQAKQMAIEALAAQRDEGEPPHTTDINAAGINSTLIAGRFVWEDGGW